MQPRVSITLCRAVFGIVINSVLAATVIAADPHPDQIQTRNTAIHYDIPAGSLIDALSRFARQSGVAISIKADQLKGLQTPGLTGSYSIEAGFATLLAGSGYQIRKTDAGYVLQQAPIITGQTLPLMTVSTASLKQGTAEEGYRVSNVSGVGLWDERSLRDTPYSMSVVTSDLIENINAQNMGQIFKMNPLTQEPIIQNQTGIPHVTIRGFETLNPVYDGIPMSSSTGSAVSVIEIDRVEILSGTSGFLYGGGRVGGAVNYVTKSPTNIPLRRMTFGNYGGTQFYGHADIGGKFGDRGRFGYRVNLLYQGGDTAIGEPVKQKVANIVLDWRITDTLYADVKYTYNDYRKNATQPEFFLTERFSIDTSKRYSPKWASNDIESHKAYTSLRWDPSKHFTLRSAFFYQHTDMRAHQVSLFDQGNRVFEQSIGNIANNKNENYGGYIYLDTHFSTFDIDHKLTLGYSSTFYELFQRDDYSVYRSGTSNLPLSEIKNIPEPDWGSFANEPMRPVWTDQFNNILIGDVITFNDRWSTMVGLNYATTINKMSLSVVSG